MNYRDYLKSDAWQDLRTFVLETRGKRCEKCGSERDIDVHHIRYKKLVNVSSDDLRVLCRICHRDFHDLIPLRFKESEGFTDRIAEQQKAEKDRNLRRLAAAKNAKRLLTRVESPAAERRREERERRKQKLISDLKAGRGVRLYD
jgi:hypothetical protein